MSSFLVSASGISMLADGIFDSMFKWKIADFPIHSDELDNYFRGYTIEEICRELNYLNAYALEQRYGDDIDDNMYTECWQYFQGYTIDSYLKMLDCYLYQCCEGDTVEKPLYKIMNELADMISKHVNRNENPLYDEADWG